LLKRRPKALLRQAKSNCYIDCVSTALIRNSDRVNICLAGFSTNQEVFESKQLVCFQRSHDVGQALHNFETIGFFHMMGCRTANNKKKIALYVAADVMLFVAY